MGYDSNILLAALVSILVLEQQKNTELIEILIAMRIVSVNTGEILLSVTVDKTIASYKDGTDVFRFLDVGTRALEIEISSPMNESKLCKSNGNRTGCSTSSKAKRKGCGSSKRTSPI